MVNTPPAKQPNEYEMLFKRLLADILPQAKTVAEQVVTDAGGPVAAVVADPILDMLDVYIMKLVGTPVSAETEKNAAPVTLDSLTAHVAALTVATGHGTSASMVPVKAAAVSNAAVTVVPPTNQPSAVPMTRTYDSEMSEHA